MKNIVIVVMRIATILRIATTKNFHQEVKQFIREHHLGCELSDVCYMSAVRTNEFELTRVSPSICLEARIRLTPDEFSFGENLCFRHWREMARTDTLSAHKFLASEVRNAVGRSWSYGKVADFMKANSRYSLVSAGGINDNTFYASSFSSRHYFSQRCKADINYFCCVSL